MSNSFDTTVESLLKGIDGIATTKTVMGEPVTVGDTTVIPLVDVSIGVAAGAFASDKNQNAGGGLSAKISPCALLVISGGISRLISVKNQDTVTKILDMVPDIVNKFTKKDSNPVTDAIADAVDKLDKEEASGESSAEKPSKDKDAAEKTPAGE